MERNGVKLKIIRGLLFLLLFLLQSIAFAEVKEIITEGTYIMSDDENPTVAESRALRNAKWKAIEQAGTYVESYSKVKNFQLIVDEIQVLSSGVMETEILDKKRSIVGNSFNFWVKIRAKVILDKIEEMSKRAKEKSVLEDYKRIQEAYDKSQKEIQTLKQQLAEAKSTPAKNEIKTKIAENERHFQANERFEMGYHYFINNEYDKAINALASAITFTANDARVYLVRGLTYGLKEQYDLAIEDYNKAIAINPNFAEAYGGRGIAYDGKGQDNRAIADYDKAIALNPNNPNLVGVYLSRGDTYSKKGQHDRAIEDYSKAIALNPNFAEAYSARGRIYADKRKYDLAIEDFSKLIAINPNNANAYSKRGYVFGKINDYDRSISDMQAAARLGSKEAQELLDNFGEQQRKNIEDNNLKTSSENNLRIFQPGDYTNYKVTGFVNAGGKDVPLFGTAQQKVLDETQVDYYGNRCKVFRMTTDFTVSEKDRSKKVTRFFYQYFTQDLHGSLMIHGGKDSEKGIPSFVKTPATGWYFSCKSPLNIHESFSQNVELTDGRSRTGTDMVLSEERITVPAGVFSAVKTISNTLTTNADLSKMRTIETTWIVPEIGPIRSNLEFSYDDKRRMKLILEMTDTNIPYKKEVVEPQKKDLETGRAGKTEKEQYKKAANGLTANDWLEKGSRLGNAGKHREALEAFDKAIELDPKHLRAYYNRGFAYHHLGDHRQAIRNFDRAIELDPKFALAYANRGFAYSNLGNHQQAIQDASKAIELDPNLAEAYLNRSLAYGNLGNYQQVLEDASKALELDPKLVLAYVNRSFAYLKLRNNQRALEDANKAIELDPKNALGYTNRGDAYFNLGNSERAISDYKTAARIGHTGAQRFLRGEGINW